MTQAEELAHDLVNLLGRETVDKFIEDENGDLATVQTYSLYLVAENLVKKGWRKPATVHAHWEVIAYLNDEPFAFRCTNCGWSYTEKGNFCKHCKAIMYEET